MLKNALDYLHHEWPHKPVGFVSYGGVAGGTRAVAGCAGGRHAEDGPVVEAVNIPFHPQVIGEDGLVRPNDVMTGAADVMLAELAKLTGALRPMRRGESG